MINSVNSVFVDSFRLSRTDDRHLPGPAEPPVAGGEAGDFSQLMFDGLKEVNDLQQNSATLAVQAIVDPDSVDPHDVTIAAAEANLALNITKNVVDRVVRAYRDILSVR